MNERVYPEHQLPHGSQIILRAVVGSTIHGTNVTDQDDRDEMAIAIPPRSHVLGLSGWETTVTRTQPEGARSGPGDLDLVVHSLLKYARLASKGNPTILLPLFVPDSGLVADTPLGKLLRDNAALFITKDAGSAFQGYMTAQRKRMTGETGSRRGKPRQELIDKYGFDTKYAGHVIRLGLQGRELMATGRMSLPMREEDRKAILDIRTGGWSEHVVTNYAIYLEEELRKAVAASDLPDRAHIPSIDALLVQMHEAAWYSALTKREEQT
jgi:hypothetical protein